MSFQLLNEIDKNYHIAVTAHRELADVFWFIGLDGYALWNEYQHLSENMTQRKLKWYISKTHHIFMPDELPTSANIAEPLLKGKNRKNLSMEDVWSVTKEAFRAYQKWEESTLERYQKIASELLSNADISEFNFVGDIIKDVKSELVYLTDKIIELNAMDWDMPQIVGEQPDYFERYERLIQELLGKSKLYHHNNSALDANSRVLFDKYPD